MAIPWGTIKSLLFFFGPWLLPRALGYYRRLQADVRRAQQLQGGEGRKYLEQLRRPLTLRLVIVLGVLGLASIAWLLSSGLIPGTRLFAPAWLAPPENIFAVTQSRLQIPNEVVFTRLASLRRTLGKDGLTAADEALRLRFASLQSRLVYLQFGPGVLTECLFCAGTGVDASSNNPSSTNPQAYMYYALTDIIAGHLANLVLVAIATSPLLLLGRRGSGSNKAASSDHAYDAAATIIRRFRVPSSVLVLALGAIDVALVMTYDRQANSRATRLAEIDFFYWNMRLYRGLVNSAVLAALANILRLAATGQTATSGPLGFVVFGAPQLPGQGNTPAERVAALTRMLATVKSKLNAGVIIKNTALRDSQLRARTEAYWSREVHLVSASMEEREVVEAVNDALQNRIDIQKIEQDADDYVKKVIPEVQLVPNVDTGSAAAAAAAGSQHQRPTVATSQPMPAGADGKDKAA